MKICIPTQLSDSELIAEVARLARLQRAATARMVAHLIELDARSLHLAAGFPSLFAYCCEVLHLSEGETSNRIMAARVARRFPPVLDLLDSGALNLTSVRLLSPHLTEDNHQELLATAAYKRTSDVEELIAHRFPRPDIAASIRKVPVRALTAETPAEPPVTTPAETGPPVPTTTPDANQATPTAPPRRAVVAPLAPDRYEIRFTATAQTRPSCATRRSSSAMPSRRATWPRSSTGR